VVTREEESGLDLSDDCKCLKVRVGKRGEGANNMKNIHSWQRTGQWLPSALAVEMLSSSDRRNSLNWERGGSAFVSWSASSSSFPLEKCKQIISRGGKPPRRKRVSL